MPVKPNTNAGAYNRRVLFQVNTATDSDRDKNGEQLEVWDRPGTGFYHQAAFEATPSRPHGAEYFDQEKRWVENRALFRVRYSLRTAAIDPATYQILYNGATWNIQRVFDPDGGHVELQIETNSIT